MQNKINLPDGIDVSSFYEKLKSELSNNLTPSTISNLSGLLALDYTTRLNSNNIKDHLETCIKRLKNHLKGKVVTDDSFSSAMALFAAAITPERNLSQDVNYKSKDQSIQADNEKSNNKQQEAPPALTNLSPEELIKDDTHANDISISDSKSAMSAAIGAIVSGSFANSPKNEKHMLAEILNSCSNIHDIGEILELVNSDPKLFKAVADKAISEKKKKEDIAKFVVSHISKILHQQQKISQAKSGIKAWSSKLTLTACVTVAAGIGFAVTGPALPVLLVPAIVATSRVAGRIADVTHEKIASTTKTIKHGQELLDSYKSTTISSLKQHKFGKSAQVTNSQSVDLSKIRGVVQNSKLSHRKENKGHSR